ncbi:hypothetical protein AHiyo4_26910 [Arthrobacter sp. Hiyo4]|nr:hypothetical protein AHiyo4_26910 [Arthrobacter sp. Hiyo4]
MFFAYPFPRESHSTVNVFSPPIFDKAEIMGTELPHYLIITNPEDLAGGARSCR